MLKLEPTQTEKKCPNCNNTITYDDSTMNAQCPCCGVYLNKAFQQQEIETENQRIASHEIKKTKHSNSITRLYNN